MDSMILDTENLLLSPSNRARIKNRNAALQIKNGSPKLKEVLRQRCRDRLRKQRTVLFNNQRDLSDSQTEYVSIIREELRELCAAWSDDDSGFSSQSSLDEALTMYETNPIDDDTPYVEDELIMEECERISAIESMLDNRVICPLCQKGVLLENVFLGLSKCVECEECIATPNGVENLRQQLFARIAAHDEHCRLTTSFMKLSDGSNNLYVVCLECGYFEIIV